MNTPATAFALLALVAILWFLLQPRPARKIGDWRSIFRYGSYHRGYLVGIGMGLLLSLPLRDSGWFFPVMLVCLIVGSFIPPAKRSSAEVSENGQQGGGANSRPALQYEP